MYLLNTPTTWAMSSRVHTITYIILPKNTCIGNTCHVLCFFLCLWTLFHNQPFSHRNWHLYRFAILHVEMLQNCFNILFVIKPELSNCTISFNLHPQNEFVALSSFMSNLEDNFFFTSFITSMLFLIKNMLSTYNATYMKFPPSYLKYM
jgi:hypothetical protein